MDLVASVRPSVIGDSRIATGALDVGAVGSTCSSRGSAVGEVSACFGETELVAAAAAAAAAASVLAAAAEAKTPAPFSVGTIARTAAFSPVELPSGGIACTLGTRLVGTTLRGADDRTFEACDGSRVAAASDAGVSNGLALGVKLTVASLLGVCFRGAGVTISKGARVSAGVGNMVSGTVVGSAMGGSVVGPKLRGSAVAGGTMGSSVAGCMELGSPLVGRVGKSVCDSALVGSSVAGSAAKLA